MKLVEYRWMRLLDGVRISTVLLLVLWCCKLSSSDRRSSRQNSRLLSMLRLRYRSLTAFTKRNSIVPYVQVDQLPPSVFVDKRKKDNYIDMRGGKMFLTETLSCCPTFTRYGPVNHAVDKHGMLVELYLHHPDEEQKFYMTYCVGERKGKPCGFVDERVKRFSECVQKYSYQYSLARRWGSNDMYSLTAIRMPTGCHCEIKPPRWPPY